jgi:hypothetical protein
MNYVTAARLDPATARSRQAVSPIDYHKVAKSSTP